MNPVKYLLSAVLITILIFAAAGCGSGGSFAEELEERVSLVLSEKASRINTSVLKIKINGDTEPAVPGRAFAGSMLHIFVPMEDLPELTGLEIMRTENGDYRITSDVSHMTAALPEDMWNARGAKVLINKYGYTCIDLTETAKAFDIDLKYDNDTNTLFVDRAANGDTPAPLPERYSMLEDGRLTEIRSQGDKAACWAFASCAAVESVLLPDEYFVFSEQHMIENTGFLVDDLSGGDQAMALSYFAAWTGPVPDLAPGGEAVVHVQEAVRPEAGDFDAIKRHILDHGGVESSIYSDITYAGQDSAYFRESTYGYYYNGDKEPNHDILIVGWDDSFPKENFYNAPEHDGAFLCRNSWGTTFGDNGYFYISYDDTNIGTVNTVYTRVDGADNYDNIYQSDVLGFIGTLGYKLRIMWMANSYISSGDEVIKAASFYTTEKNEAYGIWYCEDAPGKPGAEYVYLGGGILEEPGYHTVDLPAGPELSSGQKFSVIVKLTTREAENQAAVEFDSQELTKNFVLTDGEGYISSDGQSFENTEAGYGCNICLKVFTDRR